MQSILRISYWQMSLVKSRRAKDRDDALRIGEAHPGNVLARGVGGDVFDGVAAQNVPVNAADGRRRDAGSSPRRLSRAGGWNTASWTRRPESN